MLKSVLNRRRKISRYLREADIRPLKFKGYESPKDEFNPDNFTIVQMIERVLELKDSYRSTNSVTDRYETRVGARRSVLDIWRHIRYYYPTVSLFEVMRNMHKVKTKGMYCPDVHRLVFSSTSWIFDEKNHRPTEFGIKFSTWKNL